MRAAVPHPAPEVLVSLKARLARTPGLGPVTQRWKTYQRSKRTVADAWKGALDGEVRHWEAEFENPPEHLRARYDPDLPLQDEVAGLIRAPSGSTVRILDCGAGPLTFLGKKHPGYVLEIRAVDALADEYNESLDRAGVKPVVRTEHCDTENLSDLFEADEFDITCARNTLDHSRDPVRCIREMLRVTKPGGFVLLQHAQNVAVKEQYLGMHQWNFEVKGNAVRIWRPGSSTDLGGELAGVATIERTWSTEPPRGGHPMHHVVIHKSDA